MTRLGLLAAVAAGFTTVLCATAWSFRPDMTHEQPPVDADDLREVEAARRIQIDPNNPPRLQVDVDYSQGPAAQWYPKGEAPILAQLVQEGKLPPVAERVGPEPVVYRGVDGIGKFGGTWITSGAPDGLMYRTSATTLVRWSPLGYPIVPHLAKSCEHSPDYRVYTFTLRKGVKWSDGHPFTADDILYWWEHEATDTEITGTMPLLMTIRGKVGKVEKLDELHVRFSFPEPHGLFLAQMATAQGIQVVGAPAHYLRQFHPKVGDKALVARIQAARRLPSAKDVYLYLKTVNNVEHPRLWPWLYRTYQANPPYSAVRNPYYWMVDPEGNQLPYVDCLFLEQLSRELGAASVASGRFSVAVSKPQEYTLLMSERKRGGYHVYRWLRADSSDAMIHVNLNRRVDDDRPDSQWRVRLLNDKRFRQALSLAINRQAIIEANYNGETEPCQVGPQPFSYFHNPRAYKSFVDYDPARAGRLLDEIGLTRWDYEGCRTFPDGSRMVFYLNFVNWLNPATAQFIVDDWAKVGVRAIPRMLENRLFYTEKAALMHDFSMWTGENEFFPLLTPRCFLPTEIEANFALGYARWYVKGGLYGARAANVPGSIPVPKDHPLYRGLQLYEQIRGTGDRERQRELFSEILDIAAENVWTINVCSSPMYVVTVMDGFKNVPTFAASTFTFIAPGNTGQETWFFEDPAHPPGVAQALKREVLEVTPEEDTGTRASEAQKQKPKGWLGGAIKWLLIGAGLLFTVMLCVRHPFVGRRLLIMIPTLGFISIVVFGIIQLPPGDFLTSRLMELQMRGEDMDQREIDTLRSLYHLDDPFLARYARWVGLYWFTSFKEQDEGLLQGNLGRSMATNDEVSRIVGDRITLTVVVSFATILFTWLLAVPMGIYSAVRQYSISDYILTFIGFIGMCVPSFLLALILMYFSREWFGIHVDRLFSSKYALQPFWDWAKVVDLLKHVWVPVVILGVGGTAGMIRVMRGNLLDELKKPYVTTARAKGVRPLKLLLKYPVRLALNPFVSGIGGIFPALVSGGTLVAVVLSLPLVGPLMLEALLNEDTLLAGSMLMILSALGVFGVLVSDLLLLWLDPRIRFEGGGK